MVAAEIGCVAVDPTYRKVTARAQPKRWRAGGVDSAVHLFGAATNHDGDNEPLAIIETININGPNDPCPQTARQGQRDRPMSSTVCVAIIDSHQWQWPQSPQLAFPSPQTARQGQRDRRIPAPQGRRRRLQPRIRADVRRRNQRDDRTLLSPPPACPSLWLRAQGAPAFLLHFRRPVSLSKPPPLLAVHDLALVRCLCSNHRLQPMVMAPITSLSLRFRTRTSHWFVERGFKEVKKRGTAPFAWCLSCCLCG